MIRKLFIIFIPAILFFPLTLFAQDTNLKAPVAVHKKKNSFINFATEEELEKEDLREKKFRDFPQKEKKQKLGKSRNIKINSPYRKKINKSGSQGLVTNLKRITTCTESITRTGALVSSSIYARGIDLLFYDPKEAKQVRKIHNHLDKAVPYYPGKHEKSFRKYDNRSQIAPLVGVRCLPTRVVVGKTNSFPSKVEYREGERAYE